MTSISANQLGLRLKFFDFIFGEEIGNLCIATGNAQKTQFKQTWFKWPGDREVIGIYLNDVSNRQLNVWFGVSLFNRPERKRDYAVPGNRVWADLDEVDPDILELPPSVVIESSPGKYQAFWSFSNVLPPELAQDYSRRLAYAIGADKSGWDLEQLLRVPYTHNYKYANPAPVRLLRIVGTSNSAAFFDQLPTVENSTGEIPVQEELPDLPPLEVVIAAHRRDLDNPMNEDGKTFYFLFEDEPTASDDWSGRLWRLINICLELNFSEEETLVVAMNAKCNKYERDSRPLSHLWKDVRKAATKQNAKKWRGETAPFNMPILVGDDVEENSFISEYKSWANEATDAPEQYHELSCFVALSAIISNGLSLQITFTDNFRPNLWGLLLGPTTISRKTTAMDMAMNIITDLEPGLILASDGSAEGILSGLSERPSQVSIFYRDEVSALFDSINRRDYLAGFPETLTKLYDVPRVLSRRLRKETITVIEPYFIFFGGGIRDKVYGLLDDNYISSGFIPRFLVVSSENDSSKVRPFGPPTTVSSNKKDALVNRFADLKEQYSVKVPIKIGTQVDYIDRQVRAWMKEEAWQFSNDVERLLVEAAEKSQWAELAVPVFTRMTFNMIKMGMLVAAARKPIDDSNRIEVEISDLKQAAFYIQKWGRWMIELIMSSGKSAQEQQYDAALLYIKSSPNGVTQSELMRRFHLISKQMRELRDTLYDRGLIDVERKGRGLLLKEKQF